MIESSGHSFSGVRAISSSWSTGDEVHSPIPRGIFIFIPVLASSPLVPVGRWRKIFFYPSRPFIPSLFAYGTPFLDRSASLYISSEHEIFQITQPDQPLDFVHQIDALVCSVTSLLMEMAIGL